MKNYIPILGKTQMFSGVKEENILPMLSCLGARIQKYKKGEYVFRQGEHIKEITILAEGRLLIQKDDYWGNRSILSYVNAGDMFGIANLYAPDQPFPSLILAEEFCRILFIKATALRALIEHEPTVLRNYLTLQSQKIVYLNRKIMTLTAGAAEKKLAVFLLEKESALQKAAPFSMSELAKLLGIGRASLYRAIDALVAHGMIEKKEKCLIVRDKLLLEQYVNQ